MGQNVRKLRNNMLKKRASAKEMRTLRRVSDNTQREDKKQVATYEIEVTPIKDKMRES